MGKHSIIWASICLVLVSGRAFGQFTLIPENKSGYSFTALGGINADSYVLGLGGVGTIRGRFDLQFLADYTFVDFGSEVTGYSFGIAVLPYRFHERAYSFGVGPWVGYEYQNYGVNPDLVQVYVDRDITVKYMQVGAFAFLRTRWGLFDVVPRVELARYYGFDDAKDVAMGRLQIAFMVPVTDNTAVSFSPFVRLTDRERRRELFGIVAAYHGWKSRAEP